MNIGVVVPQTEIGNDPAAIRDYAQGVEELRYTHVLAFDPRMGEDAGRDPATFGIEGRLPLAQVPREAWARALAAWRAMRGFTHLGVHTAGLGLETPARHVEVLRRFKEEAGA